MQTDSDVILTIYENQFILKTKYKINDCQKDKMVKTVVIDQKIQDSVGRH